MISYTVHVPYVAEILLKLTLASVLGAIVGAERDITGRPAGLRTNMIISLSSCLFTVLSSDAFTATSNDQTRIASQIVVGVGFLGAGVLMQQKERIVGLTTAADIWLVAAIGMAIGAGDYVIGTFVARSSVTAIVAFGRLSHHLEKIGRSNHSAKNREPNKKSA